MAWSFPVLRIFGIQVRMHWILAFFIAVELVRPATDFGWMGVLYGSITMTILLLSILFHELAHCWMAIRFGGHADHILLWPLGGLAFVGHSDSPPVELRVAGVGPLSSFALGGACLAALVATGAPWDWAYLSPFASWYPVGLSTAQWFVLHAVRLNLILGLFNLCVPAYPLDGGRVFMALFAMRHGRRAAAEITSRMGIVIGVAIVVGGIYSQNFMLAMIGFWSAFNSFELLQRARYDDLMYDVGTDPPYSPEPRERRPGFFARRRAKRERRRREREDRDRRSMAAQVDAVLEKLGRTGLEGLTPVERKILEDASRRARGE